MEQAISYYSDNLHLTAYSENYRCNLYIYSNKYMYTQKRKRKKYMHTTSNSFGWVSIYTRASVRCDSTFEHATEPLNLIFLLQDSTDTEKEQMIITSVGH
jgi:hypothetical protein